MSPTVSNPAGLSWFDDQFFGGKADPSKRDCLKRARIWQFECGEGANVTVWFRHKGAQTFIDPIQRMRAPPMPCLNPVRNPDCPPVGTWPTAIQGRCPTGWQWSHAGVCHNSSATNFPKGTFWRCPAGSRPMLRAPFCAPEAQEEPLPFPMLQCYLARHPDLERFFCVQSGMMRLWRTDVAPGTDTCSWRQVLEHYRSYGKRARRKIHCDPFTPDLEAKMRRERSPVEGGPEAPLYEEQRRLQSV